MSTIAVLTSGGDAPGMNAAVAGVAEEAARRGLRALAVHGGFRGLAEGRITELLPAGAVGHLACSGTWLGSSRYPELRQPAGVALCRTALERAGADGLVVIGGDGSLEGARLVAAAGAPVAFVPATIDNDIAGTAMTIGMDSAVNYALGAIDQIRVTGRSLTGRGFLVQTLGGHTPQLALAVAASAGVEDVLVPGRPVDLDLVAEHFAERATVGEAIAVMCEGIGNAVEMAAALAERSGVRVHPTILGHAQRAAAPSAADRRLGLAGGRLAAAVLARGRTAFVAFSSAGVAERHELGPAGASPILDDRRGCQTV